MRLEIERPSPKQELFLRATAKHVAFGGARGGGKSWAVRTKAKIMALRCPGIRQLIVRRTYPELMNNHIQPLRLDLAGVARYVDREKAFFFPGGSVIRFAYCAKDSDLDHLQGDQYDIIYIDEATQLSQLQMQTITACLRGVNAWPKRVYYTCNPGGQGHGYIKRLFIDKKYEPGEVPEDYVFIQSLVSDNAALMAAQPDYVRQLEALPSKLRRAWLEGAWDIFEGQFFEDFRTTPDLQRCMEAGITPEEAKAAGRWCHVIAPLDLSSGERRGWHILRSYDFGYAKPFSCAWWAVDYDGTLYRILELYGCTGEPDVGVRWTPDEQARQIAEIERSHPWLRGKKITGVADPAIWDASRGESIAETMMRHGIVFTPGDNARIDGWMQLHYRLQFDEQGYARMYIFDTCRAFIRTIPELIYSETRPEDLDTTQEDHVADETRYLCMSRPIQPQRPVERRVILTDPLDQLKKGRTKR